MTRDSLEFKFKNQPLYAKLLHECWCCHAVGLKPGVLASHLGDYGIRDYVARQKYVELALSPEGLFTQCAVTPLAEPEGSS